MKNALILVNLQNDFLPGGAIAVPRGEEVIPLANRLQPYFHVIVATQAWHPIDHVSFASQHAGSRPGDVIDIDGRPQVLGSDHCIQNSHGASLTPSLKTNSISKLFPIGKDRASGNDSGFSKSDGDEDAGLEHYLRECRVTDNYILGLATDDGVLATALDSCRLGFRTWVIEDACRPVEWKVGDCVAAFAKMEQAGVQRVRSERWLSGHRDSVNPLARQEIAKGRFIQLMKAGTWEYVERCNARAVVGIVAITNQDEFVFVEQYREPLGKRCIELPAGLVGDTPGEKDEDLVIAVRRELIEETGFDAERITFLAVASASAGLTNEMTSVFLAQGLRHIGAGGGVGGEQIQRHLVPRKQVAPWLAARQAEGLDIAMSLYGGLWMAENIKA